MTTHSQQQQMAQPAEQRGQGSAGIQQGMSDAAAGPAGDGQGTQDYFGGACGAGAGAAILWQPITVQRTGRR
ncbi:hypothetical protein ABMY26_12750 [Azospirillum sp. HJ39]|uniref:hypothetical protein n=1 Tax=Azospirillum sp. HJ39 TaxID=3159496 RepID=UPI0035568D2A